MRLAVLVLAPSLALGAPPSAPKATTPTPRTVPRSTVAMWLMATSPEVEPQAVQMDEHLRTVLRRYPSVALKTVDDFLQTEPDPGAKAAKNRAEFALDKGLKAYAARDLPACIRQLKASLSDYEKAVALMNGCERRCQALVTYAAALHATGAEEDARTAVLDLLAQDPGYTFDKKKYPVPFVSFALQVANSRGAQFRGNLDLRSQPGGARIFLNGKLQGYTPMTLQTLRVGKHQIRLEKPGTQVVGRVVEVTLDDLELDLKLQPTEEARAFARLQDKLIHDVARERGGQSVASLASVFGTDKALLGAVKSGGGSNELTLVMYELKTGRRLASRRARFQGDEYGQLENELARMVTYLFSPQELPTKSTDPLDHRSGVEDWNADARGRNKRPPEKGPGRSSDPLDQVTGTEDW